MHKIERQEEAIPFIASKIHLSLFVLYVYNAPLKQKVDIFPLTLRRRRHHHHQQQHNHQNIVLLILIPLFQDRK